MWVSVGLLSLRLRKQAIHTFDNRCHQVYAGFFRPQVIPFLLFLSLYCCGATLLGAAVISPLVPPRHEPRSTRPRLFTVFGLTVLLALLLLLFAMLQQFFEIHTFKFTLAIISMSVLVGLSVYTAALKDNVSKAELTTAPLLGSSLEASDQWVPNPTLTLVQALQTPEYVVMWLTLAICGGTALVVINNIAQIVQALGGKPGDEDVFVSIISVSNCLGRYVCSRLIY